MKVRVIDRILQMEAVSGKIKIKMVDVLFLLCLLVISFLIRLELFPIESADYYGFIEEWMQKIRENGGFASMRMEIANYSPAYLYILCALSYFQINDLYAIKLVSVLFDYVAAFTVFFLVYQLTGKSRRAMMGMVAVLLCPTVVLNSAYWCQCDILYTTFLLLALLMFFRKKGSLCLLFVGVAFAFKVQTVFLLPFLVIMWLKDYTVKFRHFCWIPVVYFISILPAWMLGRDLKELLTIYTGQADYYPWGTLEYPNLYVLLGEVMPDTRHISEVSRSGIFVTILLLGVVAYFFYTRRVRMDAELLLTLALFTVALTVYCLPHMHERYGFLVDILALICGVLHVKRIPVACGFVLVSMLSYMPYLIAVDIVPIAYLAIAQLGLVLYTGYDLYRQSVTKQESSPLAVEA